MIKSEKFYKGSEELSSDSFDCLDPHEVGSGQVDEGLDNPLINILANAMILPNHSDERKD
jgi:hypothetical protein